MEKNKVLTMEGPCIFFSKKDERFFFRWLYSVSGVTSVVGTPKGLDVTFKGVTQVTLEELLAVMSRYEIDTRCISMIISKRDFASICNPKKNPWSKEMYKNWYKAIFGRSKKRLYS